MDDRVKGIGMFIMIVTATVVEQDNESGTLAGHRFRDRVHEIAEQTLNQRGDIPPRMRATFEACLITMERYLEQTVDFHAIREAIDNLDDEDDTLSSLS